jgi:hypothetical protein
MKKCAFCPTVAALSAEHCWAVWISELMPVNIFNLTRRNQDGTFNQWQSNELNVKAKVVCKRCNNEWMSQLEQDAKDTLANMMLYGSPVSFLPLGIASIATYAFKGAVIGNFMHPSRAPFHSDAVRHKFAKDRSLPDAFQVWLFSLPRQRGTFKSYFHATRPDSRHQFQLDVFTFAAGFFGLQAVTFRWATRHYRRHREPLILAQNPVYDDLSVPLWPSDGHPVSWPPRKHLSETSLEEFITRWSRVRVSA